MGVNWELTGNRMGIGFVKKSYNCKGIGKMAKKRWLLPRHFYNSIG
jgi:hypothetical protein